MDALKQLRWRSATQKFDAKRKLRRKDLRILLETLRLAPSAYGLQPWRHVLVTDPRLRQELRKASFDQSQVTDASHYVVLCARQKLGRAYIEAYLASIAKTRKIPLKALTKFRAMITESLAGHSAKSLQEWNRNQVYLALGMLLATAAYLKIDACPMEGIDAHAYSRVLDLKRLGLVPVVGVALGYRSDADKPSSKGKVRFPASEIFILR